MPEPAKPPFEGYTLYKVYHKSEGRHYAQLVNSETKTRTTISYARYLMSVHLGRLLTKQEHVDHINGDKVDDRIENLQILSQLQNSLKYSEKDNPAELVELVCPTCGVTFYRPKNRAYRFTKLNKLQNCSRSCASSNKNSIPPKSKVRISDDVVKSIKQLKSEGLSSYKIASVTGVSRNTVMKYW